MKETRNNDSGFDYEIRASRIAVDTTALSSLFLSEDAQVSNSVNCQSVKVSRCFGEYNMSLLQSTDFGRRRIRYVLKKDTGRYKGLIIENNVAIQAIGIDSLTSDSVNNLIDEFICDFDKFNT